MKKIVLVAILFGSFLISSVNAQGQFCGSKNSNVYHYPSCRYVKQIDSSNLVWFADAQDAVNKGYRPCTVCNPPLPVANSPSPSISPSPSPKENPVTPEMTPLTVIIALSVLAVSAILFKRKRSSEKGHCHVRGV